MTFTLPAHMTMFTGLHPLAHGVSDETSSLSERIETLPEILSEEGYRTFGVYSSDWLKGDFGFDRGFDQYRPVGGLTVGSQIREEVVKALGQQVDSNDPLFLFLHYYDVHSDWAGGQNNCLPYFTPPEFGESPSVDPNLFCIESDCATDFLLRLNRTKQPLAEGEMEKLKDLYASGVEYLDFELGRVLNDLRLAGLYDDALIIITADHGEEFREHGMFLHTRTYEETLRVPLLIKFPGNRRGGLQADGLFELSDLLPTILEAAGVAGPEYIQGRSLGAAAAGFLPNSLRVALGLDTYFDDRVVLGQDKMKRDIYTARSRRYKLRKSFSDKESEFYDLRTDPGEMRNLNANQLPQQSALERELDRLVRESEALAEELAAPSEVEPTLSQEEMNRLRSLGYIFEVEVEKKRLSKSNGAHLLMLEARELLPPI
jgi:arylsulfatase A-like enzyme